MIIIEYFEENTTATWVLGARHNALCYLYEIWHSSSFNPLLSVYKISRRLDDNFRNYGGFSSKLAIVVLIFFKNTDLCYVIVYRVLVTPCVISTKLGTVYPVTHYFQCTKFQKDWLIIARATMVYPFEWVSQSSFLGEGEILWLNSCFYPVCG